MDDLFKAIVKGLMETSKEINYHQLEYNCQTSLTDEDMIKLHIDFALENGDKEKFMELSGQLNKIS